MAKEAGSVPHIALVWSPVPLLDSWVNKDKFYISIFLLCKIEIIVPIS